MNSVLRALNAEDQAQLGPYLEPVRLPLRRRLQEAHRTIKHVYFLSTGLASVLAMSASGRRQSEVAVVGREGLCGAAAILDAAQSPYEIVMQVEGTGHRIEVGRLNAALESSTEMRRVFLRAVHVFQVQSSFTALANAQGRIEERLARWLLMAQDRVQKNTLDLTHDFLALMLGVRRAGVTVALNELQRRGLIIGQRGAITLRDRQGLIAIASAIYGQAEAEFERLFPAK